MFHSSRSLKTTRRHFLCTTGVGAISLTLPKAACSRLQTLSEPVRLGMITDLHQDIMHDGRQRLDSFLSAMEADSPDAIIQLGDFAVPAPANQPLIDAFNQAHPQALHVLGNHDIDGGYTWQQTLESWKMPKRYYRRNINGLQVVVLDGNEKPPNHVSRYPSYIGTDQQAWLQDTLQTFDGPSLVISHQPLAGPWVIDNAKEIRQILSAAADRVLLAVNGHSHIDYLVRAGRIGYLHLNSASYVYVGQEFQHESYGANIHAAHPRLASTCPYQEALYTTLTVDPGSQTIDVKGRKSEWVGPSPAELGRDKHPDLIDGEHIAPRIRPRHITRPRNG